MSDVTNAADLLVGRGKIYIDRWDATTGAKQGYRFLGNCKSLEITPAEDEVRELYSSAEASAPLLKRITIRRKVTFTLTLNEFSKENTALALMGEEAEWTQAATPVVGEVLLTGNGVITDRHFKTAKRKITAVTVKRNAVALTLNTDYRINDAEAGIIYMITNGAGTGNLTIDYTPTAMTAGSGEAWLKGGKSTVIDGAMLYVPYNTTGPALEVEVWHVSISPEGSFALLGDDFAEFQIKGEVLTDSVNHPNEPYYQVIKRV